MSIYYEEKFSKFLWKHKKTFFLMIFNHFYFSFLIVIHINMIHT